MKTRKMAFCTASRRDNSMALVTRTRRPVSRLGVGVDDVIVSRRRFVRVMTCSVNSDIEEARCWGAERRMRARVEERH